MEFVRYIPEGFKKNGQWVPENLMAIDRAQWEKQSGPVQLLKAPGRK